jgi:hypothetical protein
MTVCLKNNIFFVSCLAAIAYLFLSSLLFVFSFVMFLPVCFLSFCLPAFLYLFMICFLLCLFFAVRCCGSISAIFFVVSMLIYPLTYILTTRFHAVFPFCNSFVAVYCPASCLLLLLQSLPVFFWIASSSFLFFPLRALYLGYAIIFVAVFER